MLSEIIGDNKGKLLISNLLFNSGYEKRFMHVPMVPIPLSTLLPRMHSPGRSTSGICEKCGFSGPTADLQYRNLF